MVFNNDRRFHYDNLNVKSYLYTERSFQSLMKYHMMKDCVLFLESYLMKIVFLNIKIDCIIVILYPYIILFRVRTLSDGDHSLISDILYIKRIGLCWDPFQVI